MTELSFHDLFKDVKVEDLQPGALLGDWTRPVRLHQGRYSSLHIGPEGCWNAMVIANRVADPRQVDGFGYPAVHRIDVFFWKDDGKVCFDVFHFTCGTTVRVFK